MENLLEVLKLAFWDPVGVIILVRDDIQEQARKEIAEYGEREVKVYSLKICTFIF